MSSEHVVMKFDDIKSGEAKKVDVAGRVIAIVRIGDDLYALGDTCSHANYSLSEGEVFEDEKELECWKHGSTFDLETGEPQSLPATEPVPVYTVKRDENDDVVVVIDR
jgi:3-phenylpropionate/trans-cinnamate dioxygenase ferredoxin subunit